MVDFLDHHQYTTDLQRRLRETIYQMVMRSPGIRYREIDQEIGETIPHTDLQLRSAIDHLRENKIISSVHRKYFMVPDDDGIYQACVPADTANPIRLPTMPPARLLPMEWMFFTLSHLQA
jgi:hypothetical protein